MVTSSTAKPTRLARWMVTFEDGCAVCCNGGGMDGAKGSERPIIAGPTNGLPTVGCCPWRQNTSGRAQSYHYETTDWRAGCGRSASPVRREGQGSIPCPYPYRPRWYEITGLLRFPRLYRTAGFSSGFAEFLAGISGQAFERTEAFLGADLLEHIARLAAGLDVLLLQQRQYCRFG